MERKGMLKRLTAVALGICMLTVTCFYGTGLRVKAADPVELKNSPEASFTKLTLSDFGMADGDLVNTIASAQNLGDTIDKTLFQAKMYFPAGVSGNVYWGGSSWDGIALGGDGNVLTLVIVSTGDGVVDKTFTIDPSKVAVPIFENASLEMSISTEFTNEQPNGKADIKVGVWFNGVLYDGQYFELSGVRKADFTKNLHGNGLQADYKASSYVETTDVLLKDSPEAAFTKYTLQSFGYDDGPLGGMSDRAPLDGTLEKTLFQAKMNFAKAGFGNMILGGAGWFGINIASDGTNLLVTPVGSNGKAENYVIKTAVVGEEILWGNDNLEFAISTEFVDTTATDTKLKLGVWLNGELYGGQYYTTTNSYPLADVALNLHAAYLGHVTDALKGYSIGGKQEVVPPPTTLETQQMILSEVGIEDGVYDRGALGERAEGFKNTSLIFTLKPSGNVTPRIHFGTWSETDRTGINILFFSDNTMVIGNDGVAGNAANRMEYTRVLVKAEELGLTGFLDQENKFELKTEYIAAHTDEVADDIRFTIFVNDKEAAKILIKDQAEKFGNKIYFCDGIHVVGTPKELLPPDPLDSKPVAGSYEKLTLRDFMLDKVNVVQGTLYPRTMDNLSLDGKSFGAKMQFSKDNNGTVAFYIGGPQWYGVRVQADPNGTLGVSYIGLDGSQKWLASVNPEDVGMTTFLGETFELQMTFDVYKKTAGKADCKIGLYINGNFYGEYLKLHDVDQSTLMTKLFVYGGAQGTLNMQSVYSKVDMSIWGLTNDWRKTLGLM